MPPHQVHLRCGLTSTTMTQATSRANASAPALAGDWLATMSTARMAASQRFTAYSLTEAAPASKPSP